MRKIFNFIGLALFIIQLFSCSKNKDYVEIIPEDVDFVVQINPKTIAEKGNFKNIETYNWANVVVNEIKNSDPTLNDLFEKFKSSPTSSGLDLISPIYIFGKKHQQKNVASLVMNMNKKSDFESQLKIIYKAIYKKEINFIDEGKYTFIAGQKKPFVAWNNKHFIFIASEFGTSTKVIDEYFKRLISSEKALKNTNNSFADFLKKSEDINIWYTGKFLNYFNQTNTVEKNEIDLTNSAWATYLSFNNDNISITQKFHPDPATKIKMEKRPIWKSKINSEIFKFFPKQSYLNIGFAVHPSNAKYIISQQNYISEFINNYDINPAILAKSVEGEILLSVFDFESRQTFKVKEYFGKKEKFANKVIVPQFILAGKMKDQAFYNHLISTLQEGLIKELNYYTFPINSQTSLYITQKNNVLYITNNHIQISNFINDRVEKINFIQSDYSNGAKYPLFANVNLNLEEYPTEVKDFFFNQLPFGETTEVRNFAQNIEYLKLNFSDEYTKNGQIKFKNIEGNSLELILKFIDNAYSLYLNPQINLNERDKN